MLALGIDPGKSYDREAAQIHVDAHHREVILPHMEVSLLDCANSITAAGGDLTSGWTLILRDRSIGTVTFAQCDSNAHSC